MLLALLVEVTIRLLFPIGEWYGDLESLAKKETVNYVFLGSSRVACSINSEVFTKSVGGATSRGIAVNMGKGYSTLVEHLFGIERLIAVRPRKLTGVTVFLEAPYGNPDLVTWQQSWLYPDNPELLAKTMRFAELGRFWFKSEADLKSKLLVTAQMMSATVRANGRWKAVIYNLLQVDGYEIAKGPLWLGMEVRTDSEGVRNARKLAVTLTDAGIRDQQTIAWELWEKTVLKSLNDRIRGAGGRLVLFRMPLSSVQQRLYATEIGQKNSRIIGEMLERADIPVITPVFRSSDDDFPDLWHLRGSRNAEFTRSVAAAFLDLQSAKSHR